MFLEVMSRNIPNKVRGPVPEERGNIRSVQNETDRIIRNAKNNYFLNLGETLSTYGTGSKSLCTTLERLVKKKTITNIPLLVEGNNMISDFRQKSNILVIISLINVH